VQSVTLVGDRGMLKGPQVQSLPDDFRYITAITKPQIQTMLGNGIFQYELFSDHVCEVVDGSVRYILRRNPIRAEEMAEARERKLASIAKTAEERTRHLIQHPRAHASKALDKVNAKIRKLKTEKWLRATVEGRLIRIEKDEAALSHVALLDGCYVIKSDVPNDDADAKTLHSRYCDLEMVERAFRTMKTTCLELRPIYVTKKTSTQGHVFVVMLALLLQRELERYWVDLNVTVEEGIDELAAIHMQQVTLGNATIQDIPIPTKLGKLLLDKAAVTLPTVLPSTSPNVHTKKSLPSERN